MNGNSKYVVPRLAINMHIQIKYTSQTSQTNLVRELSFIFNLFEVFSMTQSSSTNLIIMSPSKCSVDKKQEYRPSQGAHKIYLPPSAWSSGGGQAPTRPTVKQILTQFPSMERVDKIPREVSFFITLFLLPIQQFLYF